MNTNSPLPEDGNLNKIITTFSTVANTDFTCAKNVRITVYFSMRSLVRAMSYSFECMQPIADQRHWPIFMMQIRRTTPFSE